MVILRKKYLNISLKYYFFVIIFIKRCFIMHGFYAEYVRSNCDDDLIISEDRIFFKSITNLFLSKKISFEEYKNSIFERLTLINLEYNGYNVKTIDDQKASQITLFIIKCITPNCNDDCIENCFKTVSCMTHFQMFDDANHRTGYRLLDMLLSYNGYDLDIKKIFKKNKESITYIIPLIDEANEKINIDYRWYDSIKPFNIEWLSFNEAKKNK